MALAYGITTFIALCMVGVCVLADKKRDVWLILVFVSVSVCNLGYFMLSISKDLADALNSNRLAYLRLCDWINGSRSLDLLNAVLWPTRPVIMDLSQQTGNLSALLTM